MRHSVRTAWVAACCGAALGGCACEQAPAPPGCSVRDEPDGSHTISCTDGTRVTVRDGRAGGACTAVDRDGTRSVRCSDGTEITLPDPVAGGCTVESIAGGGARVSCDDGSEAVLPPGRDGRSCTIVRTLDGERLVQCADGTAVPLSDGADGGSCSVFDNGDGTYTIRCDDGTTATVSDGAPGGGCTVADDGAGTKTIRCGDGTEVEVRDGEDGGSCAVTSNGDGTTTITCPDGTTATITDGADGSSCSVLDNGDGTYTISCEDGTSVTIWPGAAGAGAVHGFARLLAREDHTGITVTVEGTGLAATTDAAGEYRLLGVPAGLHALAFELAGYGAVRREGVAVLPGTYEVEDVTLRVGTRIDSSGPLLPLAGSPSGDALVAIRYHGRVYEEPYSPGATSGEAVLYDLRDGSATSLASGVSAADFAPDDRTVLLQEHSDYGGATRVVDRATLASVELQALWAQPRGYLLGGALLWALEAGVDLVTVSLPDAARTILGTDVDRDSVHPTEDGLALAFVPVGSYAGSLQWFDAASGTVSELAAGVDASTIRYARGGWVVAFSRWSAASQTRELLVVDVAAGRQHVVGPSPWPVAAKLSSDGRWLAYDSSGTAVTWDLAGGVAGATTPGDPLEFEPAGSRLLVCRETGAQQCDLLLFDAASGSETVIAVGLSNRWGVDARFSPDGRDVAYMHGGSLRLWELATGADLAAVADARWRSLRFSPDGSRLVLVRSGQLNMVELGTGLVSPLHDGVRWEGSLSFSADGRWLLYERYPAYFGRTADLWAWDFLTGTGRELGRRAVQGGGFSADGMRAVVLSGYDASRKVAALAVFDARSGELLPIDREVGASPVRFAGRIAYELRALYLPERDANGLYVAELP